MLPTNIDKYEFFECIFHCYSSTKQRECTQRCYLGGMSISLSFSSSYKMDSWDSLDSKSVPSPRLGFSQRARSQHCSPPVSVPTLWTHQKHNFIYLPHQRIVSIRLDFTGVDHFTLKGPKPDSFSNEAAAEHAKMPQVTEGRLLEAET